MASVTNISAVTVANTFGEWRIQTNLDTDDVNEIARGDFVKPRGNVNLSNVWTTLYVTGNASVSELHSNNAITAMNIRANGYITTNGKYADAENYITNVNSAITVTQGGLVNIANLRSTEANVATLYVNSLIVNGVQGGGLGAQGAQGAAGTSGTQGARGAQGAQGSIGIGVQGALGPQGPQGYQGVVGATGPMGGPQGAQGLTGAQGAAGAGGAQGAQGAQGGPGSSGPQGLLGAQGAQGSAGAGGAQGAQGAQGVQGSTGSGTQGAAGVDGAQGAQGAQGFQGVQGSLGSGTQGAPGAQGAQGSSGAQGAQGAGGSGTKTYARFTPMTSQPPASNFATLDTRNSIAVLDFDATTDESATWVDIMPESAQLGSGLLIRIHWMATSAASGTARWGVQLERMNTDLDSDSFDTAATAGTATSATPGVINITEITLTTIDSVAAGDAFRLKVYRDADGTSGTDDMTGDAELVCVEVRSAA